MNVNNNTNVLASADSVESSADATMIVQGGSNVDNANNLAKVSNGDERKGDGTRTPKKKRQRKNGEQ